MNNNKNTIFNTGLDYGKIPPQAVDIEEAVLGALLLIGTSIYEIADILMAEAFYKDEHQKVCQCILNLFEQNKSLDLLTVTEELRKQKKLDEVGGPVWVTQLTNKVGSAAHIKEHYGIVFQKYIQRELIRASGEISMASFDEASDLQDVVDKANSEIDSINDKVAGKKQASHISTILKQSIESLRKREAAVKAGKMAGIRTPLKELDKFTQGWQPGVIVIGARPGQGKTALCLAIAKTAAQEGKVVNLFSLEMENVKLSDRLIMGEADIEEHKFRTGFMGPLDWKEVEKAQERLQKLPLYIDDNPIISFNYIKAHARLMKNKNLCDMIILDYLQLADTEAKKGETREREIAKMMRNIKVLQKQLKIPIVILSQLNRSIEGKAKRPDLTNLRESGSIEQDADIVIFIHRPEYYGVTEDADGNSMKGVGHLYVDKNREGPTSGYSGIKFSYNPSLTKIWDWVDPNKFKPMDGGKDRQLPPERELDDLIEQQDLPF